MTTVLIADGADPTTIATCRCSISQRLLARLRAEELDRRLAEGVSPDSSAVVSLRARRLIATTERRKLARQLRVIVRVAARPRNRLDPHLRLARRQILRARETFEVLADKLERPSPVDPRGVARVHVLLRDGEGPLYNEAHVDMLELLLEQVLDALEPSG